MFNLELTDNSGKKLSIGDDFTQQNFENLLEVSNISIEELCNKNPNLLIFPKELNFNKDNIQESRIFSVNYSKDKKISISTGNLMGFIRSGDVQISIKSRFDKNSSDDFFLNYMLQKVNALNLFDLTSNTSKDGMLDLLLYVFPYYLKRALSQGLFKCYQSYKRNDENLKGVIDVSRHIKTNKPFMGKIAYDSRENTFDNYVTQLIRHTIEYIKTKPCGKTVLSFDKETKDFVKEIIEITPSYSLRNRSHIISKNLKPFSHPFFTEYKNLVKLCKMILNYNKLNYGNSKNEVYGVLFDGAWLWEEYLATILIPAGFNHGKNKERKNGISVYAGRTYFPDFYRINKRKSVFFLEALKDIPEENYVLDAKYKHLDFTSISRDDLNQMITYMHILPAKYASLIYPYDKNDGLAIVSHKKPFSIYGLGGELNTFGVPIPQSVENYNDFVSTMHIVEDNLKQKLFQ